MVEAQEVSGFGRYLVITSRTKKRIEAVSLEDAARKAEERGLKWTEIFAPGWGEILIKKNKESSDGDESKEN